MVRDEHRAETLHALRRLCGKVARPPEAEQEARLSLGIPALDALLPGRGLERGSLVEWLASVEGCGAATLAGGQRAVLLATNRAGYGRLSRLLTLGKRRSPKGECQLTFGDVADFSADLLACVLLDAHQPEDQADALAGWRETFGDHCYALASLHRGPHDDWLLQRYLNIAQQARIPLVASNGVPRDGIRSHVASRSAVDSSGAGAARVPASPQPACRRHGHHPRAAR